MAKSNEINWGIWATIIGSVLILIDGIAVLTAKTLYGWSIVGLLTTGWIEIILSLVIMGALYYYKKNPKTIGWSIVILSLITLPCDGGFWTIGAWIALIGGALIAYEK